MTAGFDQDKKEAIYLEYRDKVLGYLTTRLSNRTEAEDLCSDVFLKVYSRLDTFDPEKAALSTWIYSVARNTLIDYFRTRRVHGEIPEELAMEGAVEDGLLERETLSQLARALEELPQEQRDIVILRYYRGMTLQDIAKRMDLPYGVTKLRHQSALAALRRSLEVA